jgi:mannosyltransferase OCH1-like enzyme
LLDQQFVTGSGDAEHRIPNSIVQFWNADTLPSDVAGLMSTWREKNPDYEYILFDDVTAGRFLADRRLFDELRAFRKAKEPGQRADLFRLAYLASEGGYYADADDRCLVPINSLVPPTVDLVAYQESYATIANDFIGAAPGHPVIVNALRSAVQALHRGDRDVIWLSTGPGLMTRSFAGFVAAGPQSPHFNNFHVFEEWQAQRFVGTHCPAAYKRTLQH